MNPTWMCVLYSTGASRWTLTTERANLESLLSTSTVSAITAISNGAWAWAPWPVVTWPTLRLFENIRSHWRSATTQYSQSNARNCCEQKGLSQREGLHIFFLATGAQQCISSKQKWREQCTPVTKISRILRKFVQPWVNPEVYENRWLLVYVLISSLLTYYENLISRAPRVSMPTGNVEDCCGMARGDCRGWGHPRADSLTEYTLLSWTAAVLLIHHRVVQMKDVESVRI